MATGKPPSSAAVARIDLYSDTVTRPGQGMRRAIAEAEVGDEQHRLDPTVNRLVERVSELLGAEDALFLPSGTMCNMISLRVHCSLGDEAITDRSAHIRVNESGGPAALAGVNIATIDGDKGVFTAHQLREAIRPIGNHFPRSRCVIIEQTANLTGGVIWPIETIREVCDTAKKFGLSCHMDGARLFNAVVETGVPGSEFCRSFDSAWIDFSKGLGAPVGAALTGSADFIREAWRFKHQFGGAMRQSGIVAAAALYAIEHNITRLADDHRNARRFAEILRDAPGITVEPVHTNMVFFTVGGRNVLDQAEPDNTSTFTPARVFADAALNQGVRFSVVGPRRLRAVTHLDVTSHQVEEAAKIALQIAKSSVI